MIDEYFDNSEIFITGASGVIGKAVLEKLLRCCSVKCVYVLLRTKRNDSAQQRLEKLRDDQIFRRQRAEKANEFDKVKAVAGDITLPLLGVSPEDRQQMANVSFIIHCAATVRFDEPLLTAINLNVGGTLEALRFAESLRHLKVFMHVSTMYSNPYLTYQEAKIYPSPMDWKVCLEMCRTHAGDERIEFLTKRIIEGFPNTYTFTKNLAESVVNEYCDRLPVIIFRPPIITSSVLEPEPGFPTAPTGAVGCIALICGGFQKTIFAKPISMDFLPLDICVNLLFFNIRKTAAVYENSKPTTAPVSLSTSLKHQNTTVWQYLHLMGQQSEKIPCLKALYLPGVMLFTTSKIAYQLMTLVVQILPCLLIDGLLRLFGIEPVLMRIARKAFVGLQIVEPFFFNFYDNEGTTDVDEIMKVCKNTKFDITLMSITTHNHLVHHSADVAGKIREIFYNEDESSLPLARRIRNIKRGILFVMQLVLAYYLVKWLKRLVTSCFSSY